MFNFNFKSFPVYRLIQFSIISISSRNGVILFDNFIDHNIFIENTIIFTHKMESLLGDKQFIMRDDGKLPDERD